MKKFIFWILALSVTLGSAIYQRKTGPTYPKDYKISEGGSTFSFELPRSQNGFTDAKVSLEIPDPRISGFIVYRKFPTSDPYDTLQLQRENDFLVTWLPRQPPAGKLEYRLNLLFEGKPIEIPGNEFINIRFKDEVPAWALIPHIILIFSAMLLSNLTGIFAMAGVGSYRFYTGLTLIFFLLGGMLMGPVVQKFAFGEYWTGFPFGKDLTDNKALIAFLTWIVAWIGNRKGKQRRYLAIIASIVTLAVFLIPHSMMGSELDPVTGEIKTGSLIALMLITHTVYKHKKRQPF